MRVFVVAVVLLAAPGLSAQERGETGHGVPSLFPAGYLDHDALTVAMKRVAAEHPGRVRVESLARTMQGRDVWMATVGPGRRDNAFEPAVLIVANLEADHVVGSMVALGIVERMAGGGDPELGKAFEGRTIHVVPRLNPDGAERALKAPRSEFRTNLRPVDRDRDGRSGEDGPDDLDGDGLLTRMRVKDGKATLVADDADPRVLRKADRAKGERPVYSELSEGTDDDGDGAINEDPPGGVDLNRNWPHRWTEFDPEAGSSPAGEPEVRALIQFCFDHPEIAAVWSFGLDDNLRKEPKKPDSTLDDADLPLFAELARRFAKTQAKPKDDKDKPKTVPSGEPPGATTDGSLVEWAYHQYGVVGLASRLWTGPELAEPSEGQPPLPPEGEARWLVWNDRAMGGRAFVPFKPVAHPTLGPVEVGGWVPGVRLNPPVEQVGPIADAHLAFLADLARRLARLEIVEAKAEARGGGIFQVSAAVENAGTFPTALAQGVRTRKADPILVRLDPSGAKLLAGRTLERIDTLPGSGGRREFRWLVLAPESVKAVRLEASCPKGGRVVKTIDLK